MKPRHKQFQDKRVVTGTGKGKVIGYVGEFDVYIEEYIPEYHEDLPRTLTVIGPTDVYPRTNYDCFAVENGGIRSIPSVDLNITPYHMCLLYALCIEHGILEGETNET
jgi:hypothetical protein